MDKKYYKGIVEYIVEQPGNYDFKKTVGLVGVDTMAELCCKAPGRHFYVPSNKTLVRWLCVMTIKNQFKKEEDFKGESAKVKIKQIANLFKIRPYRIKKIWKANKWVR